MLYFKFNFLRWFVPAITAGFIVNLVIFGVIIAMLGAMIGTTVVILLEYGNGWGWDN